ncbi:hypothetical protein ANN_21211 [Periplaneta americana]|uniref:Uncharacterized protein n=1 Tax=Periplaneta americana TaxID=6978 RepID=A0ABQ8SF13_PERAM|nr:hypothetical protein ANN_21211 [Periplaneta americana]
MRHEIQNAEDGNKKQQLMLELRAHRLRAKAFYTLMKQKPHGSLSFAFDLQVQPLPKLNIGEAYYTRQISFYCSCVTNIEATQPACYVWNENKLEEAKKISSAVTDFLSKTHFHEATTKLFADGCGGQNKNQHLMHSVAFWLIKRSQPNLKEVCFFFPVRGHPFLPDLQTDCLGSLRKNYVQFLKKYISKFTTMHE